MEETSISEKDAGELVALPRLNWPSLERKAARAAAACNTLIRASGTGWFH
ncbi:hypothetical protein [Mesorhizobium sp. BH1-1-4]|nr:hypothetical protein [Mesorhizobium sp. BH1-1-4]MBZ9998192.1 hypothetical protein [Mesorhizobium sp. BH1-1-4]